MEKSCSICKRLTDSESSPILAMGSFGNPRYLCPECADDMEAVTSAREYHTVLAAMKRLGDKLTSANVEDELVVGTVNSIFSEANERAEKIREGNYDFEAEEAEREELRESVEEDDIPEELRESEEDKLLDEREKKINKKFDAIMNWVMAAVFVAALIFFVVKFLF